MQLLVGPMGGSTPGEKDLYVNVKIMHVNLVRPTALLAHRPPPTMLTDGCPAALLALRPHPIMLADGCPATFLAPRPHPTMLADGCPAALLAQRPIPVMLAVPCLSIPDADLLFLVQILSSRGPVRLLHRPARDELCRLARHWHHKYNECRDADVPSNDHTSLGEF